MNSGDFVAALEGFFGSAAGLSASVVPGSLASGKKNATSSPTGL
ncbi:MAG TPA: hypothetical protein VHZ02_20070 [Acidimicrobiales bacterium]|nr:hypothetical protein [Acidimicrobiales bacterium]